MYDVCPDALFADLNDNKNPNFVLDLKKVCYFGIFFGFINFILFSDTISSLSYPIKQDIDWSDKKHLGTGGFGEVFLAHMIVEDEKGRKKRKEVKKKIS